MAAGVSCKDLSKANPHKHARAKGSVLAAETSRGGTADTWHAYLQLITVFAPLWLILENSDELVHDEVTDWGRILTALHSRGYRCKTLVMDTAEFSLPQHRGRAYLVAVLCRHRSHDIRDFEQFHTTFTSYVASQRRIPPSVLDVLLPNDDERVDAALHQWEQHEPALLQGGTCDAHFATVRQRRRSPLVMSYGRLKCRDSTAASRWFAPMNQRMKEVLAEQQADTKHVPQIMLHDVSQSMNRCPRSSPLIDHPDVLIAPAILPNSDVWITMPEPGAASVTQVHRNITEDRFLLPDEYLLLQGWPLEGSPVKLSEHPGAVKQSFAGHAFSSSVVAAVCCALMASVTWSEACIDQDSGDSEDAYAAVELLKTL